jgi:ParB/RepB/Spo0J family partition protein
MSTEQSAHLVKMQAIHDRLMEIAVATFGAPVKTKMINYMGIVRNPYQRISGIIDDELTAMLKHEKVWQPFWLRRTPGKARGYQLLYGVRWIIVADRVGQDEMLCTIVDADDTTFEAFGWLEGLMYETPPPLKEAQGLQWLLEHGGYTIPTLAAAIGQSTQSINDRLALLEGGRRKAERPKAEGGR